MDTVRIELNSQTPFRCLKNFHRETLLLPLEFGQDTKRKGIKISFFLYTSIHSSINRNGQKAEITQMALNGEIDQQNVDYTYNVVLLRDPDACYNMDEP